MHPVRKSSSPPSLTKMSEMLKQSGISLNQQQLHQLWAYHNLLRSRNQDRDLTRIIGFESMVVKHYVDSMIVGKFVSLPSPLLDLGSGAGFPGIPLKIRYPHLRFTLAEPRPRRAAFLKEAVALLHLKNVDVFEHKVVSRSFRQPVKAVITRAVEDIEKTILRTSACITTGGLLIFMKGPSVDPEIEVALKRFRNAYRLTINERYHLPGTHHLRRLVVLERTYEL